MHNSLKPSQCNQPRARQHRSRSAQSSHPSVSANQASRARVCMAAAQPVSLLVLSSKSSPELEVLKRLTADVNVVGIGRSLSELSHLTDDQWASVNVLLNCGVGKNAASRADVQELWPRLKNLKWMHSSSAGLEHLLFPELRDGPVVLTNAKGVYSHSLAEWTLTACNWFAKDLPRMRAQQKAKKWEQYDVEELRGRTLGVIGYGDIGQACARLARAFRMKVVALRRRTQLTEAELAEGILTKLYSPDQLNELMSVSDYIVMATPWTPQTDKMVGASALAAMKPHGVFINVGRGKCVDEAALIQALKEGRIRGAALDVTETEPCPTDSPLWELENVLLSPHTADRTKDFQFESLEFFIENIKRFSAGQEPLNIVDKKAGY